MGEYVHLDGLPVKLGVGEDLFYVRRATFRAWLEAGRLTEAPSNLPPAAYLDDAAHTWRWRFPFPDEDRADDRGGWHGEYERGYLLTAPAAIFDGWDHRPTRTRIVRTYGGDPPDWLPAVYGDANCPQTDGAGGWLEIVAQRRIGAALWTVVRCPYCGEMARLSPEMARALADAHADDPNPLTVDVLARVLAGYTEGEHDGR